MKYYIYLHRRNDTDKVFYVGKGSGRRIHSYGNRNKYWHRIVSKVGYSAEIFAYFIDEKDALLEEVKLIFEFRQLGLCEANLNEGGTGLAGRSHSEETKLKISKRSQGCNNPMFGLKRPHSSENLKKMRGENHPYSKKVIDTITKKVYPSVGEAARQLGYRPPTLATMLNGWRTNKTTLVYMENFDGIST